MYYKTCYRVTYLLNNAYVILMVSCISQTIYGVVFSVDPPAPRPEKAKRGRKKRAEDEEVSKSQKRRKKDNKEYVT